MKQEVRCSYCGAVLTEEEVQVFDGVVMCDTCLIDHTVECDNCGERIWSDNADGDENHVLCAHCYEYEYTRCEECGWLIHNDEAYYENGNDEYPYCERCFFDLDNKPIKNYRYKPHPILYGEGNMHYGVELEIDGNPHWSPTESAKFLLEIANRDGEKMYIKRDGSLSSVGLELVSHPATLNYHLNNMHWDEILSGAVGIGYRSHDSNNSCGLHVHCSKDGFGETIEEQENAIGRVVYFVEKHWSELVKLSRRTSQNLNRWAARYATISDTTEETYNKAKNKCLGRYVAVNLENDNTLEIRLWRGSLRKTTFFATLQLVDEICKCAINLTNRQIEDMSWSEFVLNIPQEKAELIEYLKEKRLYVNEPLVEGVES